MSLNSEQLINILNQCKRLVKKQGQYILRSWHKIGKISYKNLRDVVTNVDIEVENNLRLGLHKLLPQAGFIVEEGKTEIKSPYNWVIDPIDGTKNYVSQMPMFMTQIALLKNEEPILGIIYNPVSDQLFSAVKNHGTYLNGQKCFIKKTVSPESAIINIDFGEDDKTTDWRLSVILKLIKIFYRVRISGGIFTAYLATGGFDAYIVSTKTIKKVDFLPNVIISQEAGYKIEYVNSSINQKFLIISHPSIFSKIKLIILT